MPAKSEAQRRLFAIAEHHPNQLSAKNRGLASLPHKTLHDFAATKGLPHLADGGMWVQKEGVASSVAPSASPLNGNWMELIRAGTMPQRGMPSQHMTVVKDAGLPHMADGGRAHWMQRAFRSSHKGGLHEALHVPQGEKIPAYRVREAAKSGDSHLRHMSQAAINAGKGRYRA